MEGLIEGRIVHFVLPNGEHRPAVVVRAWRGPNMPLGCCNLQVFTDGSNDGSEYKAGIYWATSVEYSEDPKPYTWHWPEQA